MNRALSTLILVFFFLFVVVAFSLGEPYGPDGITRENDQRADFSNIAAAQVQAQAGNVTQLTINVSLVTEHWQGYYGNITGRITLDDALGSTMYDWSAGANFAPVGEIYAANETISAWSDLKCINFTGNGDITADGINLSQLETMFNMLSGDGDGIDETFSQTEEINVVGSAYNCPATHLYQNSSAQSSYWNETLLTVNNTMAVIFASEVNQDTFGFDNRSWDFQMIVGEDGTSASPGPMTYYFYLELV